MVRVESDGVSRGDEPRNMRRSLKGRDAKRKLDPFLAELRTMFPEDPAILSYDDSLKGGYTLKKAVVILQELPGDPVLSAGVVLQNQQGDRLEMTLINPKR